MQSISELDLVKKKFFAMSTRIERDGLDDLMVFLKASDFYKAPASTKYHLPVIGGLVQHSLTVCETLFGLNERYNTEIPAQSIAIVGLFHDLCKVAYYKIGSRNVKEEGRWVSKEVWEVEDKLPLGHGERSVIMIQRYIKLKVDEIMAIRWHMGPWEPGFHFHYPLGAPCNQAFSNYKLLPLLFTADFIATKLVES